MVRRTVLVFTLLAVVFLAKGPQAARAAERLDVDTIKLALHASEEENDGFIERVVALMNAGQLPRASVTIAFAKAKKQAKHKFQYFKRAMIELAGRDGVSLAKPVARTQPAKKTWWQDFLSQVRRLAHVGISR